MITRSVTPRNSYNCAQAGACADLTFKHKLAYLPRELNAFVDLGQTVNVTNLCDFDPELQKAFFPLRGWGGRASDENYREGIGRTTCAVRVLLVKGSA